MQNQPKISIMVPIWNMEEYLDKCLNSIVNQTYKNLEIICINNGSTDKSGEILEKYAAKDPRIVAITQEHTPLSIERNVFLDTLTGEYLTFVDADDWLEPDVYEKAMKNFQNDADIDMVVYPAQVYKKFDDGRMIKFNENFYNFPMRGKHLLSDAKIFTNMSRVIWNKVFKTSIIKENNIKFLVNEYTYHEDAHFCFLYSLFCKHAYFADKIGYNHIKYTTSTFAKGLVNDFARLFTDNFKILSDVYKVAKANNQIDFYKTCIYASIMKYLQSPVNPLTKNELKEICTCLENFAQLAGDDINDDFIRNIREKKFYKIKQLKLPAFKLGGKLLGMSLYKNDKPQINLNLLGLKIKFHYKKSPKEVLEKFVSTVKTDTHKIINICGIKIKIRRNITAPSKKYTLELKTDGRVIADVIQKHLCTLMLHQKNFAHYKNFYNGKDVVVCGAGPTLQYYSQLPDCIHIATNRAFLYNRVKFNYLFTQDWIGIQHLQQELINYKGDNCIKFFGTQNGCHTEIPESFAIKCNALRFNTDGEFWPTAKFAVDISTNPFGNFHTIVLTALQFVLYTNPKRIFIVGCDSVPSGHFNSLNENDADRAKQIALQQKFHNEMYKDWQRFKNFVQVHYPDTEIISVNPIKLKGLFKDVYTQEYLDANNLDASGLTILTGEKECLTR